MQSRGFLSIPEQIKKHCSWILHVSSVLDLLLLYISMFLVIQVMQTAIYCQNITYRTLNQLHPKKQYHHSCSFLDTCPRVFKPVPGFVKWRQLCYSSFLMSLWPGCTFSMEHSVAHSRCSLSGESGGWQVMAVMMVFMPRITGEPREFMRKRCKRWSSQGSLLGLPSCRKLKC